MREVTAGRTREVRVVPFRYRDARRFAAADDGPVHRFVHRKAGGAAAVGARVGGCAAAAPGMPARRLHKAPRTAASESVGGGRYRTTVKPRVSGCSEQASTACSRHAPSA